MEESGFELENRELARTAGMKKQRINPEKSRKKRSWKLTLIGLVFSLGIFATCINFTLNYKENFIKITSAIPGLSKNLSTLAAITPEGGGKDVRFFTAGGFIFSLSGDKLTCYDKYAKALWQKSFVTDNAAILPFSNGLVVAEKTFGDIYVISKTGEIKSQKLDFGAIREIKAKDGVIAVLAKDSNEVVVFDAQFKKLGSASVKKGYMTSWDFSPRMSSIAFGMISAESKGIVSSVTIMGYDGKLSELISAGDCAIYGVDFGRNYVRVISDRKLVCYDIPEARVRYEVKFKRSAVNFDVGEDGSIAVNNAGNDMQVDGLNYKDSIISIDKSGKPFSEVQSLATDPSVIRHSGKGTVIYGNGKIVAYDKRGKSIAGRDISKDVSDILVVDDTTICLVYKNKIEVLRCSIG